MVIYNKKCNAANATRIRQLESVSPAALMKP